MRPAVGVAADWYSQIDEGDARLATFFDCLANGEPICGRLNAEKIQVLFGGESEYTQSIALIPVGGVGLIAIGSADSHRFYPGMGTLFLRWIGELYQVAMLRCRR